MGADDADGVGAVTGWKVLLTEQTDTPHVVPIDDLRGHEPTECWCGPTFDEDVWVHHAMDKREEYEPDGGARLPS